MRISNSDRLLFIVIAVVLVIAVLYPYSHNGGKDLGIVVDESEVVIDDVLNYIIKLPNDWFISLEDKGKIESIVEESGKGEVFNLYKHSLVSEVTPIILLKDDGEDQDKAFMSISFRGVDKDIVLSDLVKTDVEDFKSFLRERGHTGIEVLNEEVLDDSYIRGISFVCKANFGQTDVYYTVVEKLLDSNIAVVIHGSMVKDNFATTIAVGLLDSISVMTIPKTPSQVQQEKSRLENK